MASNGTLDKRTSKPIEDFDDILEHVGGWGRFQYFTTLVFFLFNMFLGYVYLSPIITLYTPPHSCRVPALANTSLVDRRRLAIPPDPDTPSQCRDDIICTDFATYLQAGTASAGSTTSR